MLDGVGGHPGKARGSLVPNLDGPPYLSTIPRHMWPNAASTTQQVP